MASEVKVIFVGDPSQLFRTADLVEARLNSIGGSGTTGGFGKINTTLQNATTQVNAFANQIDAAANKTIASSKKSEIAIDSLTAKTKNLNAASKDLVAFLSANDPFLRGGQMSLSEASTRQQQFLQREAERRQGDISQRAESAAREYQARINALEAERDAALRAKVAGIGGTRQGMRAPSEPVTSFADSPLAMHGGRFVGTAIAGAGVALVGASTYALGKLLSDSIEAGREAELRARALRSEISGMGIDFRTTSKDIEDFGNVSKLALGDAQTVFLSITRAAEETNRSVKEISRSSTDIAAFRSLDASQVASGFEAIAQGKAPDDLLGRNSAAVLDLYAASLGRTADSLTLAERQQALFNEVQAEGNRRAGEAALALNTLDGQTKILDKTYENLTTTISKRTTPALANLLGNINRQLAFGINPLSPQGITELVVGQFVGPPVGAGQLPQETQSRRQQQLEADARRIRQLIADAARDPRANIANFSIANFADQRRLNSPITDVQNDEVRRAIERGKESVNAFVRGAREAIATSDLSELRSLSSQIFENRNLMPFDEWKKLSQEVSNAMIADIQKAEAKVKELGETHKNLFDDLFAQANRDNPFVPIYQEGEKALKSFREESKGLTAELRAQGEQMIRIRTQTALFRERVNTAFEAADLRDEARRLRERPESDTLVNRQLFDRIVQANINRSQFGGTFGSSLAESAGGFDKLTDQQRRSIFEVSLLGNAAPGLNRESLITSLARARLANPQENLSAQERFDRDLQLAGSFRARSAEEQAIIDSRLIARGRNIDPESLRTDQREQLATVIDRQAARVEQREQESLNVQKEILKTNQSIDANQKAWLKLAQEKGLAGVNARFDVNVNDGTSGKRVEKATAASDEDVDMDFNFGGFPFARGSNR